MDNLPEVSIVVIGLNEAKNLDNTFKAIESIDYPKNKVEVIYCDTGSSDNSVRIAQQYTDKIFVENSIWPTPGLARNRGILESKYEIIHFIDGDIQISKDYLKRAVIKLQEENIHAVYGYLEEKSNSMLKNTLIDHWKRKKFGYSTSTGGGGTYKKESLLRINGYDERLRMNEEIELGSRFRARGYNIWLMNTRMGTHHYDEINFWGLIKRHYKNGQSMGIAVLQPGKSPYMKKMLKKVIRYFVYSFIFLLSFLIIIIIRPFHFIYFFLFILLLFHFYIAIRFSRLIIKKKKYHLLENYVMLISFPFRIMGIFHSFFRALFLLLKGHKVIMIKKPLNQD